MTRNVLGIFARQPVAGQAKTRLAASTSPDFALRFAHACLDDWLDRLLLVSCRRVIAYTPTAADVFFTRAGFERVIQGDGELGQRMQRFFRAFCHADEPVVIVGSDSPTVPLAFIEQAFRDLKTHDVVVGPAVDGGYYLLGARSPDLPIFDGVPWSTAQVLEATIARLAGFRVALLPPWYDVDTAADWAMLRGHVLAMRRAGADPGVPRVERLIEEFTP